MSNHEDIIRKAAKAEGTPYPLDGETRKLSEGLLRGLDDSMAIISGEKRRTGTKAAKKWIKDLEKEAEELRDENRRV